MEQSYAEMPRYKSHKIVHALKIRNVIVHKDDDPESPVLLIPEDPIYAAFRVDAEYARKHDPKPGGYYVVYADGYKSFSPAAAFEEGYTRV